MDGDAPEPRLPLYRYRFGTAEFDEAGFELHVGGIPIEVQRKPLEILAVLLRHGGQVVTKDELLDTVWAGMTTVENVVANAMTKLRNALGDGNAARIVTQPRVGYRFDGKVERVAVGSRLASALDLKPGMPVPGRENFSLGRLIGRSLGSEVWTTRQARSGEVRVYKFSPDGERLAALKREATLSRVLHGALGARDDIARVLDWNFETPPFFLECEFGGQNLIEWAEDGDRLKTMPLEERLRLFLQIVDAASAAHGVGVLHKDLKPTNILVAPKAETWQVRLTDFGSGRLLEPDRLEEMGITRHGLGMTQGIATDSGSFTPLYLAPELLAGETATLRSDIYALGLILYQMIVADFRKPLISGWERDIPDALLRADIAEATDGDPTRRLDSAAELGRRLRALDERRRERDDLRAAEEAARIALEAVKRVKARRPWLIATAAALSLGLVVSLTLYFQLRRDDHRLADEVNISRTLTSFLTEDLIAAADPSITGRSDITVAEAAKTAATKIDTAFKDQPPEIRAALHASMAHTFHELSDYEAAAAEGKLALAALRLQGKLDRRQIADAQLITARALTLLSRLPEARDLLEQAERTLDDPEFAGSEMQLRLWMGKSWLAENSLNLPEGLIFAEKAWDLAQRISDLTPRRRDDVEFSLADLYRMSGKLKEADDAFRNLIERQTAEYGAEDARPSFASVGLANVLDYEKRYEDGLKLLDKAVPILDRSLGPTSTLTIDAKSTRADIYYNMKKYEEAINIWTDIAAAQAQSSGEHGLRYLMTEMNIGESRHLQGKNAPAEQILRQTLDNAGESFAATHPLVQLLRYDLADCLLDVGRDAEAPALLDGLTAEALNVSEQEPDWDGRLDYQMGRLALRRGDPARARDLLKAAGEIFAAKNPGGLITPEMIQALIQQASTAETQAAR